MLYLYIFIDDICICTYWQTCLAPFQTPQKHAEEEQTSSSAAATPGSSTSSASVGQLPPQFPNVSSAAAAAAHQAADYEAEEEPGLELPPPMKPIQEPHLIANGPPAFPKDLKESSANMVSVREEAGIYILGKVTSKDLSIFTFSGGAFELSFIRRISLICLPVYGNWNWGKYK